MAISTGSYNTGSRLQIDDTPSTSSTNRVLFEAQSSFVQSSLITVHPGRPVMLIAYVIPEGAEFTVEGVSVGSRAVTRLPGSPYLEASTSQAVDVRFREPMDIGGNTWKLTPATRRIVIALPGTYLLSLNNEDYLGQTHVELTELGDMSITLPVEYLAGLRGEPESTSDTTSNAASSTGDSSDEVSTAI